MPRFWVQHHAGRGDRSLLNCLKHRHPVLQAQQRAEASAAEATAAKETAGHELALMRRQLSHAQSALAAAEKVLRHTLAAFVHPLQTLIRSSVIFFIKLAIGYFCIKSKAGGVVAAATHCTAAETTHGRISPQFSCSGTAADTARMAWQALVASAAPMQQLLRAAAPIQGSPKSTSSRQSEKFSMQDAEAAASRAEEAKPPSSCRKMKENLPQAGETQKSKNFLKRVALSSRQPDIPERAINHTGRRIRGRARGGGQGGARGGAGALLQAGGAGRGAAAGAVPHLRPGARAGGDV